MEDSSLEQFIHEVTGDSHLRVETDLGDGFVRLKSAEAERRQAQHDIRSSEDIVIEMLRNSRDAGAHTIFLATSKDSTTRSLTMIDDGDGVPLALFDTIFEPRVTSKLDSFHMDRWGVHGRGMALYSIRCNAESSEVMTSERNKGTSIRVRTDTTKLSERTDQSGMPRFFNDEDGRMVVRGPRNINRTVAEFALEEKDDCVVFMGSDVEILATMVDLGTRMLPSEKRLFPGDVHEYPLIIRPSLCHTPNALAACAISLGLDLSERSARRVLDGQIQSLKPFLSLLALPGMQRMHPMKKTDASAVDARGLKMDKTDIGELTERIQQAFVPTARDYYLDAQVTPEVKVTKEGIRIFIPTVKDD